MNFDLEPFDLKHIIDQWGGPEDELYQIILQIFIAEADDLCKLARLSLENGQRADLLRAAHTLSGAAANIGAIRLSRCSAALETLIASGDDDRLEEHLVTVEEAWLAVRAKAAMGVGGA
jgi:HPt (histidine-containing phosphotransfer) domain-containing protein